MELIHFNVFHQGIYQSFLLLIFGAMILVFVAIGFGYLTAQGADAAAPGAKAPDMSAGLRLLLEGGLVLGALVLSGEVKNLTAFNWSEGDLTLSGAVAMPVTAGAQRGTTVHVRASADDDIRRRGRRPAAHASP